MKLHDQSYSNSIDLPSSRTSISSFPLDLFYFSTSCMVVYHFLNCFLNRSRYVSQLHFYFVTAGKTGAANTIPADRTIDGINRFFG